MARGLKQGAIARIDRPALSKTKTAWVSFFQEERLIRDLAHGANVANPGGFSVGNGGSVATFNASQSASALVPIIAAQAGSDWSKAVVIARIRSTGAQSGDPGCAFGIFSSTGQGGVGVGFSSGGNVGALTLHNSGTSVAAGKAATIGQWYTVAAQANPNSGGFCNGWVDGVSVSIGGQSGIGAPSGPDEIAVGAEHRSTGFLRQFRGDIEWAAVLIDETSYWFTDEIAARMYADDYPYNLIAKPANVWPAPAATSFNPAWAYRSNVVLGAGASQ